MTRDIEDQVERLRLTTSAELDQRVLDDAFAAMASAADESPTVPSKTRVFTIKRVSQLAAAAMILLGVVGAFTLFSVTNGGATFAFAEITQNMQQMPWLHAVVEGPGERLEAWFNFERRILVAKRGNGEIRYQDDLKQIVQIYDPDTNRVTVSQGTAAALTGMGASALDFPKIAMRLFEDAGGEVRWERGTYKERDARIGTVNAFLGGKDMSLEMIVDAERNVVLFIRQKAFDKTGELEIEAKVHFDYPDEGPESIHDVGLPASAISTREEEEKSAYEQAFEEAISVIESREEWPAPRDLVIAYWQARAAKNYDEMAVFWPGSATWNRQVIEKEEPVEYVFGEVQAAEVEGYIVVPYASGSYYDKHGEYSLKMLLSDRKSAKKRYYIVSGN